MIRGRGCQGIGSRGRANQREVSIDELYRRPGFLFRRCRQRLAALYLERAPDLDLTLQQYTVLHGLRDNPWIEQTALCDVIVLDRSTVATLLARLEEKGLIARKPAADNRRKNLVALTPAGETILTTVVPILNDVEVALLAPLSAEEQATLLALLTRLATG
jgi:DNA-binding MarR family transcriptional regulator